MYVCMYVYIYIYIYIYIYYLTGLFKDIRKTKGVIFFFFAQLIFSMERDNFRNHENGIICRKQLTTTAF